MTPTRLRTVVCAAAAAVASAAHAAVETFDVPTASTAQTAAVYGYTNNGVGSATVSDGRLHLAVPGGRARLDFGAFAGDVTISVDLGFSGLAGSYGMGLWMGDHNFMIHPGYAGGAFRIDGVIANTDMGYTPSQTALNRMTLDFDVETATANILVVNGANPAQTFNYTYVDAGYVAGVSSFGLFAGSGGPGTGDFDNLRIDVPAAVPEPATVALLPLGGLALCWARRRARLARP